MRTKKMKRICEDFVDYGREKRYYRLYLRY